MPWFDTSKRSYAEVLTPRGWVHRKPRAGEPCVRVHRAEVRTGHTTNVTFDVSGELAFRFVAECLPTAKIVGRDESGVRLVWCY